MAVSQEHKGFKWTVGDASNPTLALLVDNTSEALHIAKATDAATNWNVDAYSDPTVLIHCEGANAATDYIKMWHDDTDANIDCYGATAINFGIGGTNYVEISTSAIYPTTTNTVALGTSSLNFTDVYLDSGAIIYFDTSNLTLTHSAGVLTLSAGNFALANGNITMTAAGTGNYDITIKDNVADALSIVDNDSTPADYMVFTSTTGSEKITITPALYLLSDIDLSTSTTGTYDLVLNTNQADALSIKDSAADIMVFDTTTGTPAITITPITTITGILTLSAGLLISTGNIDLSTATTGSYEIVLKDNQADALSIVDDDATPVDFMVFTTTTSGTKITVTPDLYLLANIDLTTSTTGTYDFTLKDNQADALSIVDNDSTPKDYMVFCTTTGSEKVTFSTPVTFSDDITHTAGQFISGSPAKMTITSKNDSAVLTTAEAGIILVTVDAKTMTLPAASGNAGLRYIIKQTAVHTTGVTVDGNLSETIDGNTDPTSTATYDWIDIVCDGSNWHTIGMQGTWS